MPESIRRKSEIPVHRKKYENLYTIIWEKKGRKVDRNMCGGGILGFTIESKRKQKSGERIWQKKREDG